MWIGGAEKLDLKEEESQREGNESCCEVDAGIQVIVVEIGLSSQSVT